MPDAGKKWHWIQARWYLLVILGVFLDSATKIWVEGTFSPAEVRPVIQDFFAMTLVYNTGAAFSFLANAGGWQQGFFILIALLVSGFITVWLLRLPPARILEAAGLSLIMSGAIGNLIDRMVAGKVTDFILVHWKFQHFFPAFNVADILINLGVALLLLDLIRQYFRGDASD